MVFFHSLNKQNPSSIKQIIPQITKNLIKLSNSFRSGVSKEAIMLVGEILNNFISDNSPNDLDVIKQLLNFLFQYATSNKKFIEDTSNELIQNAIELNKNFLNLEIICIIIDLMKDKKTTVCETCPNTYNQMIKNIDLNSPDIPDDTWNKFFDKINELYKAKKEAYTKKCVKIIEYIVKVLTKEKFYELLNKLKRGEEIKKYEQWEVIGTKKKFKSNEF